MSNTAAAIEALLFATAESYSVAILSERLGISADEIESGIAELTNALDGHSIMLVREGNSIVLATRAEHAPLLESVRKDALSKDLSKASAETLAIICYHKGVSKTQIEFIRGVNVSYSIRALEMRGLIEGRSSGRTLLYYPTLELLEWYGIANIEGLPEYAATKQKIDTLLTNQDTERA